MLKVYAEFAEKWMAVPVMQGVKSETERFAGALDTYTIEAMMQDGKALQSGTSHFLGQNFAKAFGVQYLTKENKQEYVWATSWGVSTRLIGALIMTHSDDNGLVLPPRLAPLQVVIIPIGKGEQQEQIASLFEPVIKKLNEKGISVKYDDADNKRPGFKFADYELKGVPVRIVMGGRDLEAKTVEIMRRDTLEKETVPFEGLAERIETLLEDIQENIFNKAKNFRDAHIYECDNYEEFKERVKDGGFFLCHWDGTAETEAQIKEETQATIRCVPFAYEQTPGTDMVSGKPAKYRVLIARSY
jgi:prolyl-tRNA synthetase